MLEVMLQGTAVSEGISIGEAFVVGGEKKEEPRYPAILIGRRINCEELAGWDTSKILGIALEEEERSSPVVALARERHIPAVFEVGKLCQSVTTGEQVIVDGYRGEVYIRPGKTIKSEYKKYQSDDIKNIENINYLDFPPVLSRDNVEISIKATAYTPQGVYQAMKNGAAGIGLVRTELIFENLKAWPSEEEQLNLYKNLIKKAPDLPVTIRTLDIGGEKQLPYTSMPLEENPVMGLRGIRFSLEREEIFKTQLRAILRAGVWGRIKLLLPMVTDVWEIKKTRAIIEQVKKDLKNAVMEYDENLEVGIMIEVPAAATTIDILAEEADFFSIGTNDLVQYLLAVQRQNDLVTNLYDPLHPAVLRVIDQIVSDCQAEGKAISVCGDMAGDKDALLVLLGLGIREFSVNPELIPEINCLLKNLMIAPLEQEVANLIEKSSASEIRRGLAKFKEDYLSNF